MNNYLSKYYIEDIQWYFSLVLVFCALVLSIFYIYLINSSVLNTVAREQNNKQISQMVIKLSSLENSYIARKRDLNIDMARSLGFEDDFSRVHFTGENTNTSGKLSLLGDEI